jgi:hypothetical protein
MTHNLVETLLQHGIQSAKFVLADLKLEREIDERLRIRRSDPSCTLLGNMA